MRKLTKWLVVSLLVLSIGGHWAVLQSMAWVSMTVSFSQDSSLTEAIEKTFDGKHPCRLCKLVRAGKSAETKQTASPDLKKVDLASTTAVTYDFPALVQIDNSTPSLAVSRVETPPSPPPRPIHC